MNIALYLDTRRDEIIKQAMEALSDMPLRHYGLSGKEKNRQRISVLFDLVLNCIRTNNYVPMISYSEIIAKERYNNGFEFHEVHAAYNVLEESSWKKVIEGMKTSAELPEALRLISTILGAGKEALAATYIKISGRDSKTQYDLMGLFGRN